MSGNAVTGGILERTEHVAGASEEMARLQITDEHGDVAVSSQSETDDHPPSASPQNENDDSPPSTSSQSEDGDGHPPKPPPKPFPWNSLPPEL